MKYRIFSLLILALVTTELSAKELRVAAGETLLITPAQQTLELQTLILADGAQIRFAEGVKRWQVNASRVVVGKDVLIDGRGAAGTAGRAGGDVAAAPKTCEDGMAGQAGSAGSAGGRGVDISLSWGIAELGGLHIVTDGGAGGSGGRGGHGQAGGDINKCRGGNGGDGGIGGAGGAGGDAGEISLVYWLVGNKVDTTAIVRGVSVSAAGGPAGQGGNGGRGGAAEEGRYMKGSFAGNKKWLAGGEQGAVGKAGASGRSGREQPARLLQDFASGGGRAERRTGKVSASLPAKDNRDTVDLSQRVQQLEQQLETLENRLRKLEQQSR